MSYRRLRVKIMTIRQALIPNDPEGFFGFEDDRSPKIPFSDRRFAWLMFEPHWGSTVEKIETEALGFFVGAFLARLAFDGVCYLLAFPTRSHPQEGLGPFSFRCTTLPSGSRAGCSRLCPVKRSPPRIRELHGTLTAPGLVVLQLVATWSSKKSNLWSTIPRSTGHATGKLKNQLMATCTHLAHDIDTGSNSHARCSSTTLGKLSQKVLASCNLITGFWIVGTAACPSKTAEDSCSWWGLTAITYEIMIEVKLEISVVCFEDIFK